MSLVVREGQNIELCIGILGPLQLISRTTSGPRLVVREGQNIELCIGILGPLQLISRTTSGPRSRLWESLLYGIAAICWIVQFQRQNQISDLDY